MTGVGGPWIEEQSMMLPSVSDFAVALPLSRPTPPGLVDKKAPAGNRRPRLIFRTICPL